MLNYTHISGAVFPNGIIEPKGFLDATTEIAEKINAIKEYQKNGNYDLIDEYIAAYPDLKKYIMSSEDINRIEEELRNLELYSKYTKQQVYYQDEIL